MHNLRTTGSWYSYLMIVLFFLLIITALLTLLGIGGLQLVGAHRAAGILFSISYILHLVATIYHFVVHSKNEIYIRRDNISYSASATPLLPPASDR